jgi:toxin ParE1/3/4
VTSVIWSPQSLHDVESIRIYIAEDSAAYAELVVRRIVAAVEHLHTFPESGRMVTERNTPDIREIIVSPYRVVYRRARASWRLPRSSVVHGSFPTTFARAG